MNQSDIESLSSTETRLKMVREKAGRDEEAYSTVRHVEFISSCVTLGVLFLCLLIIVGTFFFNIIKEGLSSALLNGIFTLAIMIGAFILFNGLLQNLVVAPYRSVRYGRIQKHMTQMPSALGLHPSILHSWRLPTPGLLTLDSGRDLLYINMHAFNYRPLLLAGSDIVGAKVERESEVHTKTTHGGSLGVFSRIGIGYNFGSSSKSKSVVVERAFLEIHYQRSTDNVPGWVAIPYEENRRDADSVAAAINRIRSSV